MEFQSKLVATHPDELFTECFTCHTRLAPGSREYFLELDAPGFCTVRCLMSYYREKRDLRALTHMSELLASTPSLKDH